MQIFDSSSRVYLLAPSASFRTAPPTRATRRPRERSTEERGGVDGGHNGSRRRSQSQGRSHHDRSRHNSRSRTRDSFSSHDLSNISGYVSETAAATDTNLLKTSKKSKGFGLGGYFKGQYQRRTAKQVVGKGIEKDAKHSGGYSTTVSGVNPFFSGSRVPPSGTDVSGRRHRGSPSDAPEQHRPADTSSQNRKGQGGVLKFARWMTGADSRTSARRGNCPLQEHPHEYAPYSSTDFAGYRGGGGARRRSSLDGSLPTDDEADDESEGACANDHPRSKSWIGGESWKSMFGCLGKNGGSAGDRGGKIVRSLTAATTIKRKTRPVGPSSFGGRQDTREADGRSASLRAGSFSTDYGGGRAGTGSLRAGSYRDPRSAHHDSDRGLMPFMSKSRGCREKKSRKHKGMYATDLESALGRPAPHPTDISRASRAGRSRGRRRHRRDDDKERHGHASNSTHYYSSSSAGSRGYSSSSSAVRHDNERHRRPHSPSPAEYAVDPNYHRGGKGRRGRSYEEERRRRNNRYESPSPDNHLAGMQTRRGRKGRGRGSGDEQHWSESDARKPFRPANSGAKQSVSGAAMAFSTGSTAVAASPWSS